MKLQENAIAIMKKLREEKNLSQKEVAEKLMVDRTVYTNIELGKREITLNLLEQLSAIYGVGVEYFLSIPSSQNFNNSGEMSANSVYSTFNINVNVPTELLDALKKI